MALSCQRCGYNTTILCNIKSHFNRKITCNDILQCDKNPKQLLDELELSLSEHKKEYKFICEYCQLTFKTSQGKYQHKQHCKKKVISNDKDKLIEDLKEQLKNIASTSSGNTTYNITQNNITQNIFVINNFGNENIDHIINDKELLTKCMSELDSSAIENVVRKVYYDDNYPENHTIFCKNIRLNQVMVRENGNWISKTFRETIPKMIHKSYIILNNHINNMNVKYNDGFTKEDDEAKHQSKITRIGNLIATDTKEYKNAVSSIKTIVSSHKYQ